MNLNKMHKRDCLFCAFFTKIMKKPVIIKKRAFFMRKTIAKSLKMLYNHKKVVKSGLKW